MKNRVVCAALVWSFIFLLILLFPAWASAQTLSWQNQEGYRVSELPVPKGGKTGFTLLANSQCGIAFTNTLSMTAAMLNQNLLSGAGVAAGDYDGDGLCDLFFCNLEGRNALYRNLGNWRFEDVTDKAGVGCTNQFNVGAVFADVNGDGLLDLLVTSNGGPNACFINEGNGHFKNVTAEAGLVQMKMGSTSMALADVNGDGFLDLYVANYGEITILRGGGTYSITYRNGKPEVVGRYRNRLKIVNDKLIELGVPDVLYLNDGKGKFMPVSWTEGAFLDEDGKPLTAAPWDMGLSVTFRDINGDGFPDIYVCNDFQMPDRIWINNGKGQFRALDRLAMRSQSNFSMGVDFADINHDGKLDFVVVDMLSRFHHYQITQMTMTNLSPRVIGEFDDRTQIRRNTVFLNRGDNTWAEIANFAGLEASDWTWCPVFMDVDLDGWEDLLVSNGHAFDTQDWDAIERIHNSRGMSLEESRQTLLWFPPLETPNYAFRNRGDLTFQESGVAWGFNSRQVTHGLVQVDLDNDGDMDIVGSCLNAPPLIYRNETAAPRVAVRLKGRGGNAQGIGAKLKVIGGAVPVQSQEVICGGRYLSGEDPLRVFAAGSLTNRLTIEVTWRRGARSVIHEAKPNCIYEIDETGAQPGPLPVAAAGEPEPFFQDVSELIAHTHTEDAYDDLARQRLLPRRLSQLGPGVAWFDADADGHDELIVGSGKGGHLAVFRNDGRGGLKRWQNETLNKIVTRDQTTVLGWTPKAGSTALLIGASNFEDGFTNGAAVVRYDFSGPAIAASDEIPAMLSSTGPLAMADFDGDGDLDLFVGGRTIPGRYPEAASSRLFRNEGGKLVLDEANCRRLEKVGLASGAVFSDLNGDGLPELILACEWGPVKIFRNHAGRFTEWNPSLGWPDSPSLNSQLSTLNSLTGWWNGVTTGDIDGDGQLDIIASNWGLNSAYRCDAQRPERLYYGEFTQPRVVDLIEAQTDPDTGKIVPRRELNSLERAMPFLRIQFPTHKLFGEATVSDMFKARFGTTSQVQANTLASMLFLNRSNRFETVALPSEGQFAPAFAVNVADFDGDGHEDIFLSQNFFAYQPEMPRSDAGRSLWLRGSGNGKFVAMSGQESGLKVYGEQRGAALGDFDEDGRVDFVVTQNGAATKLYRNKRAKPGLRVRLVGPANNPHGIGGVVRLKFGERWGAAREIHGGSGYWSQDSTTVVLALPEPPTQAWVRWPGGKTTLADVPKEAREISLEISGAVKLIK